MGIPSLKEDFLWKDLQGYETKDEHAQRISAEERHKKSSPGALSTRKQQDRKDLGNEIQIFTSTSLF